MKFSILLVNPFDYDVASFSCKIATCKFYRACLWLANWRPETMFSRCASEGQTACLSRWVDSYRSDSSNV